MSKTAAEKKLHNASVRTRVPEELKQRWQGAAALRGQTLTDFIIVAANKEADEILENEERILLSREGQIKLAEILLNPPELPETMENLLREYMGSR